MTTAEYAVGTAGAVCIGCVFITLTDDPDWLTAIFDRMEQIVMMIRLSIEKPWL